MRPYKPYVQYRYYDVPPNSHVLALLGVRWSIVYTTTVSDLHFHNCLEVGYCHDGAGVLSFADDKREYASRMFLPCATSLVSYAVLFRYLFAYDGLVNHALVGLGILDTGYKRIRNKDFSLHLLKSYGTIVSAV